MIASFGMYDRPETAALNDRLWQLTREALGDGPATLDRETPLWDIWQSPDLLLAQTCGMPYRTRLHGTVTLVATPDHGFDGVPEGHYCSVIVTRRADAGAPLETLQTRRMAVNDALSQSGWAAPVEHFRAAGLTIGETVETGSHRASAKAVAEGRADWAALDLLSWEMMQRFDPFAAQLTELARTAPTPALPFITAQTRDPAPIRDALACAIAALAPDQRDMLGLAGLVVLSADAYLAVPTPAAR
ncbi:phosphate/phosphite/phosphonate ABC transporter substrate-binding protein [Shimia biformata]|uniref:phosphate/phosphite/phosphonate ABC transporter substrate-binding protein n=1 Tax=Shimia biformata TaxID=1294299 RepID=UPI00194FC173|nr:PhnD/SsuA/transferrin family substrate-binding protein [Shimia biformata]